MRNTLLFLATATMVGCSTDLDINAPYQENTVVYGLLNMRDSLHFVKVNKAFLGEGSAFVYAQVPDSNEYRDEDITKRMVYRVMNGQRVDSFPLRDTLVTNREPGTFYSPTQRLYYFHTPDPVMVNGNPQINSGPTYLYQNSDYELVLDIRGDHLSAVTSIVADLSLGNSLFNLPSVNLYMGASGYANPEYRWNSGRDGKRYTVSYTFNYSEVIGNDTIPRQFNSTLGTVVTPNSQNPSQLSVVMNGELFYSNLANAIKADPSVSRRIFTGIDLHVVAANDPFHVFLTLSEPVSGIVEERPAYSNVDGGLGIFASRYTRTFPSKTLTDPSLNELINGQYTGQLRFCSAFNVGAPYGCN